MATYVKKADLNIKRDNIYCNNIDYDIYQKFNRLNSKQKLDIYMTDELSPTNYNIINSNIIKNENKINFYFPTNFVGNGTGNGNMEVNNFLRFSNDTRDISEIKYRNEQNQFDRWNMIDNRFQANIGCDLLGLNTRDNKINYKYS